jgi:hypothetical protein
MACGDSSVRSDARMIEGMIAIGRERPRQAAAAFLEAARWTPRSEQAWFFAAQALKDAGDAAGATALCRRGIAVAEETGRLEALLARLERRR